MFRLHKHRSDRFGDRFDFNFSSFQALQVPKGWDKLFVSIISVETGKTTSKSGKASVRNGSCRWTETLTESIFLPQDDASKETEERCFKLVVSMGSARSAILGEATINLASYTSSKTLTPVSLPLKRCSYGTTLQVKVQCLTPKTKPRDEEWKDTNSYIEDGSDSYDDMENKSDVSDSTYTKSVGSSSSNRFDNTSLPGELSSRDPSFSASRNSFDYVEDSLGSSPRRNLGGVTNNLIGRQDSTGSQNGSPYGSYSYNGSNHLSNSKVSSASQNQRESSTRVPRAVTTSPLQNAYSSKELLEATEARNEELQAEARLWEQKARRLMADQEKSQKEISDHSEHQATLEMKLSESQIACDGLKQEIEQLKTLLGESAAKQTATDKTESQAKDMDDIRKELEDELKFHKESNANLALQLEKSQESNIELVSILQELEMTIDKQKMEIASLSISKSESEDDNKCDDPEDDRTLQLQLEQLQESQEHLRSTMQSLEKSLEEKNQELEVERSLKAQALVHCEAEWRNKLAAKEEEVINLESKLSKTLDSQGLKETDSENGVNCLLIKEIEVLKQKAQELERDCNELTEENLNLLFKLKESSGASSNSSATGCLVSTYPSTAESPEEELKKEILIEEVSADHLQVQCMDLENKCADLELQLQAFKDKADQLESELSKCHAGAEEQKMEIAELKQQLECYEENLGKEPESDNHLVAVCTETKNNESHDAAMTTIFSKLDEQLQLLGDNMKKQQYPLHSSVNSGCNDGLEIPVTIDFQKQQFEAILNNFIQLKRLFDKNITEFHDELQCSEEAVQARVINVDKVEGDDGSTEDRLCSTSQGVQNLLVDPDSEVTDLRKELSEKISEVDKLKADNILKNEEAEALRRCQGELENQISELQEQKCKLEEYIKFMRKEGNITSSCLDDLRNEMAVLHSNMDSQVSANKTLERKSSELENSEHELDAHLAELEEENIQLSERISGLEAQVRYLTDERVSGRLELQKSESHAMHLQDEIKRLENEMKAQKVDMKQKVQEIQDLWLESQEECKYLKMANPKLQATAENLIEECSSLQKSNGELRRQKIELHERCSVLEAEMKESQEVLSRLSREVEACEEKFSSLLEEIALKEKALNSELDAIILENEKHKEKLIQQEGMLTQMLEKTVEVENLQMEVAHLIEQISTTDEEREKTEAVLEVSCLRADKAMLQAALEEVRGKLRLSDSKLDALRTETEAKIMGLMGELAASKQNQEVMMADNEKLLGLFEGAKSSEVKIKNVMRVLEIKLKVSEYEKLQQAEEMSDLKARLQKIVLLQDEVLALRRSLDEAKFENERIEASCKVLSGDYEELKAENISLSQKISTMEKAVIELEDCRCTKDMLEEKVLRLEGDLTARDALNAQEAEVKNELARLKRVNSQFQRKIKSLEEENEESLKRAQAPEEGLEDTKGLTQDKSELKARNTLLHDDESKLSLERENSTMQLKKKPSEEITQEELGTDRHQRQVANGQDYNAESSQVLGFDPISKIQLLEIELAEALESNDMYKSQLRSFLSEREKKHEDAMEKLGGEEEAAQKGPESALQIELKDLHQRYFHMSLKYAQVESEREELLVKLRDAGSRKSWFL